MKKVLWISRHEMTAEQLSDLKRVMDGPVEVSSWRDTIKEMGELATLIHDADAVAAVLPPEMLSRLLKIAGGRPVLRAISGREPTGRFVTLDDGRVEQEFTFIHQGWEQVLRADFVTCRL